MKYVTSGLVRILQSNCVSDVTDQFLLTPMSPEDCMIVAKGDIFPGSSCLQTEIQLNPLHLNCQRYVNL